jgi:hypothetical protein
MVFISYSHADAKWSQDLLKMAAPLQLYGGINVWSDADIAAGSKWRATIQQSLDKAAVAVLLISRHFLTSKFIMEVEMPCILKGREQRGLTVLWAMVSHCLYEETPLQAIQAVIPPAIPLEGMREVEKNAALKAICLAIKSAWLSYECPVINPALNGAKVQRRMENLHVLASPARRRVEVFVRADNTNAWYHQGPILEGRVALTCNFGNEKTTPGTGYHILAITTNAPVPHQQGKPTKRLPKERTRSKEARVLRS